MVVSIHRCFAVASSCLLVAGLVAACGAQPPAASATAPATASGAHADTPVPADHNCNFANFYHDEAKNSAGPGKCATDCDCDGMRSCKGGACDGKARPEQLTAAACNSKDYHYREAWTPAGDGKCSGDCECDGQRTCASGQCTGTAR